MERTDEVPEIDVTEAQRRIDDGAFFLDVREDDEYQAWRIPGAVLLPLSEFMARYQQELPRDREIVIHCRSGRRSADATRFLRARGYDAVNVAGGIIAWEEADLPVVRGDDPVEES